MGASLLSKTVAAGGEGDAGGDGAGYACDDEIIAPR
jgi:hypothetical protein